MASRTISTKLAIEGEAEYKQAISNINSELKNHQSELKLVQSQYQNHQNSLEALKAKEEALKTVQTDLTAKVEKCKDAYQNAQNSLAEYQTKTANLKTALEQNKTALSALDSETQAAGQQWADYNTKVEKAEAKLKELSNSTGDTSTQEAKLQKEIAEAKEAMAKLEEETDGAAKTAGELITEQTKLTQELENAEAGETAATKACNSWQQQENNAQIALNNVNAELEKNEQYMKEAEASTDECATSIDEFGNKSKEAGEKSTNAMQNLHSAIVSAGLAKAIKEIEEALEACVETSMDFEAEMSTVAALSGATADELEALTSTAKQMGATTAYTAEESAEALEYMAMAGWNTEQAISALPSVLNLAASQSMNLGEASDIVTDYITAFGLSVSDAENFVDQLAYAATHSNTTVSQLSEAYKSCAATAGSMGYSVEDTTAVLMTMADAGIKGGEAGTTLNAVMTRLATDTSGCATALSKYGVEIYDSKGNMNSLSNILNDVSKVWGQLTDQEQAAMAKTIAGTRQYAGLQTIMNGLAESAIESGKSFNDYSAALSECSGTAATMAETKLDNLAGKVTLFESAMDGLKISVGDVLSPVLGDITEQATSIITNITEFTNENPAVTAAITAIAVAAGVVLTGIIAITVALPALKTAIDAVTTAMTANPFGAMAIGITAAIAAVTALIAITSSYQDSQESLSKSVKELHAQIKEAREEYEELKAEMEESAETAEEYGKELADLADKTDLSVTEQERMAYLVEQLSDDIPELADAYDDEAKSISLTGDEIKKLVKQQNEQTKYQSDIDRMNALLDEQAQLTEDMTDAQLEYNVAQQKYNDVVGDGTAINQQNAKACYQATSEYTAAKETLETLTEDYNTNAAELAELTEQIENYSETQQTGTDSTETAILLMDDLIASIDSLKEEYEEAYNSSYDSISGQKKLWEEYDKVVALTFNDIMDAIQNQLKYLTNYNDNVENLRKRDIAGLDELIEAYDDGSEQSAAFFAGMADMTDEEIKKIIDSYGKVENEMDRYASNAADMSTDYTDTINDMVKNTGKKLAGLDLSDEAKEYATNTLEGYTDGLSDSDDSVKTTISGCANNLISTFKSILGINSPSTVFYEFGKNTLEGYTNGAESKKSDANSKLSNLASNAISAFKKVSTGTALNATGQSTISGYVSGVGSKATSANDKMKSLATKAISALKNNSTSTSLYSAGTNTIQGYINGLSDKSSTLYSKMSTLASSAISSFKKTLGIASPSKVFKELAGYTAEGYIGEMDTQQLRIAESMKKAAEKATSAFKDNLSYDAELADLADAYILSSTTQADMQTGEQLLRVEIPIYLKDGTYTRTEIVEIAMSGISRLQSGRRAAKGVYA